MDVNVYASRQDDVISALRGNRENTEIGTFLRDYLDVDVEAVTRELNDKRRVAEMGFGDGWLGGEMPGGGEAGLDHLDHYHGDFGKKMRV